jgi:hypothetical protein
MSTIVRLDRSTDRDETMGVHVMRKYDNKNGRIRNGASRNAL